MKDERNPGDAALARCAEEPIRIPGSIQPHGLLFVLGQDDFAVRQISENAAQLSGRPIDSAPGSTLSDWIGAPAGEQLSSDLKTMTGGDSLPLRRIRVATSDGAREFDAIAHPVPGGIILELEAVEAGRESSVTRRYSGLSAFLNEIGTASSVEDLCQVAAKEVRRMTGFDRVLIYRFDEEWNGTVVAEDGNGRLPSYLDLRFPASDIPSQARELYRINRLRMIPDVNYIPVPILPRDNPDTGAPIDLTHSVLRSVSPVHVQYMKNMGTAASMSISILRAGELWGLISCHHASPRSVPFDVRTSGDFLAQTLAIQISLTEQRIRAEYRIHLKSVQVRLLSYMTSGNWMEALEHHPEEFLACASAEGAAILHAGECRTIGRAPPVEEVKRLALLLTRSGDEELFHSDCVSSIFPESEAFSSALTGALAVAISKLHSSYVMWFRPELIHAVKWGGNPGKPALAADGSLNPRSSFEAWRESVRGHSRPWLKPELEAAIEFRNAIVGIVLRRAEELAALGEDLKRSNEELEAFSYSVSHDLRAPFRHIVGYSELLREEAGGEMSPAAHRYLETIVESAQFAGRLVDSLLKFSQISRASLNPIRIQMQTLTAEAIKWVQEDTPDRKIHWTVGILPEVCGDLMLLRQVFVNLLSNAVKYTRGREVAEIEIRAEAAGGELVISVRDNGVGFDNTYAGKLFGVFQRLHRMEEFEGTGIGLATVRRIVARHGGRTWAEGVTGAGATFYFSLPLDT